MWRTASILILLAAFPAPATQLTVDDCVRRATAANPKIAAARLDAAGAAHRAASAGARRLGTIDALASWNDYESNRILRPMASDLFADPAKGFLQLPWASEQLHYGIALQFPLLDGGRIAENARASRALAESAGASADQVEEDIRLNVTTTARAALVLQHMLTAADAYVAALERDAGDAELRLRVGSAAAIDAQKVRFSLAGAKADRESVHAQLRATEAVLASLMGDEPPQDGYQIADESIDSSPSASASGTRRDVIAAEKFVEATTHRERQAKKEFAPEVGIALLIQQHRAGSIPAMRTHELAINLRLPLFDGGSRIAALADARSARAAAEERLRAKRLDAAAQRSDAAARLDAARAALEAGKQQRSLGAEVARVEKLRLDQGVGRMDDYLAARAAELRGDTAYWQALYAQRNAHNYYDYVTARRFAHE